MKVKQLAEQLGVPADTVRYYTRIGFIKPRKNSTNGYKAYSKQDQKRLDFIINARRLGFSIKDVKAILGEADKGLSSCPLVRTLIEKRLEETEAQFRHTLELRTKMQAAVEEWRFKPDRAPTSEMICHLIEDFSNQQSEE